MRRVLLALFVFVGSAVPALAQAPKQLTLPECVDVALQNNLRVRRSVYNVESFNVTRFQSMMNFLPTLNLGGSYGLNYGRSINPVTNSFVSRNGNSINAQINSTWTLFNGFRITNTFRQSRKDLDAANQDLEKAKNDVIINVVTLYINVIFNKELYENNKYQLASSQQQLDRIKRQVAAGALPLSNQLTQEAQVSTNEVNLINQENALNLSLLQLKQAMQVPASEEMDVVVPELQLEDLILDQTPNEIYAISVKTMPEIKSALLKVESAQLALSAAKGNLYPRITANGSGFTNYSSLNRNTQTITGFDRSASPDKAVGFVPVPTTLSPTGYVDVFQYSPIYGPVEKYTETEQLRDNISKQFSLQLTIPIFNNWSARANVQRAAIQTELARINELETQNTLRQTIESAFNDANAAAKTYAASVKQVSAREEAYRMVLQRFELGAANFVEKQIAENDLFQSRSDLTRAKYNFIFRKKILDFYQGKKIEY